MAAQYNKYKTGEFKKNFTNMSPARTKLLIMPIFEHAQCDSMQSRLNRSGIKNLKKFMRLIEENSGVRRGMNHHAITHQAETIYKN